MTLRVNLDHMVSSATAVTGTGESVAAEHTSSDAGIAAAHAGWVGTSSTALATRLEGWTATSQALLSRLSDHAQGLHNAATAFATNEQNRAQEVSQLAR